MTDLNAKMKLAELFAKNNTSIENIKKVVFNGTYFSVKGDTKMGSCGQKLQFLKKMTVKISVDENGNCLFYV